MKMILFHHIKPIFATDQIFLSIAIKVLCCHYQRRHQRCHFFVGTITGQVYHLFCSNLLCMLLKTSPQISSIMSGKKSAFLEFSNGSIIVAGYCGECALIELNCKI